MSLLANNKYTFWNNVLWLVFYVSVKSCNDQLGENASEEYKSEEYSNSTKGLKEKKNKK